jgi:hypothetical protein
LWVFHNLVCGFSDVWILDFPMLWMFETAAPNAAPECSRRPREAAVASFSILDSQWWMWMVWH